MSLIVKRLSDYVSLASAVATIGSEVTELIIDKADAIAASVSIPATLHCVFVAGGIITTTGYTLTFNSSPEIGMTQAFAGTGTVVFGDGAVSSVYPEWFGAVGNGTTDDAAAIRSAYDAAATCGAELVFQSKTYRFNSALVFDHQVNVRGTFQEQSILLKNGNFTGITLGANDNVSFAELCVQGDTANDGIGIEITNGNRIKMERVFVRYHGSHGINLIMGSHGCYNQIYCHYNGGDGFRVYDQYGRSAGAEAVTANRFDGIDSIANTGWGFNMASGEWNIGQGIVSQQNGAGGIQFDYTVSNHFEVYTEANTAYGIRFTANSTRNWVDVFGDDVLGYNDAGTNNWIGGCAMTMFGPQAIKRPKQDTNIAGRDLSVSAGNAGAGTTGRAGGHLYLAGGGADGTTGNASGGGVHLDGGEPVNTGGYGAVYLSYNSTKDGDIIIGQFATGGIVYATFPVLFVPMTTTVRDTLTPSAGMVIYNSSLGKLQVRTAAGWETITSAL